MSKQAIGAVPATPPRYGLLIAANVIDDGARWQDGVEWAPENCAGGGAVALDCGSADMPAPDDNPNTQTADPFVVWGADKCSTFGWQARDYEGRARRMLEATQSYSVAAEVWSGDITIAEGLDNTPLATADADTVTTVATGVTVREAVGRLEGALAACNKGRRGMIHMTPQMLVHAYSDFIVLISGQLYVTPLGTIVVADAGYDGSGPNGEPPGVTQWAYATSMMQVRLSPIDLNPGSLADARAMAQAMHRNTNLVEVRAQREALVQWDRCCHFAAQVALPVPLVGGVS